MLKRRVLLITFDFTVPLGQPMLHAGQISHLGTGKYKQGQQICFHSKVLAAFQGDRRFQEKISLVTEGDTNIIEGLYIMQQHFTILYFSFSSQPGGDP